MFRINDITNVESSNNATGSVCPIVCSECSSVIHDHFTTMVAASFCSLVHLII